jgi:hypothetical protein
MGQDTENGKKMGRLGHFLWNNILNDVFLPLWCGTSISLGLV